jgi:hypothetical protein
MNVTVDRERLTRRQLLKGAAGLTMLGGGAGFAASMLQGGTNAAKPTLAAAASGMTDPVRAFHSRPDLRPPSIELSGRRASGGLLFLGPSTTNTGSQPGPMLVDHHGQPAWFRPISSENWAANVTVQSFRGQPVLTWWEGVKRQGYGYGEAVIVDSSYQELARVRAAGGRQMDMHEFVLTPEGTAVFTCYPQIVQSDLSSIGGPRRAPVQESVIQEVDVSTGRLLFEWRSLDHIALTESYLPVSEPYDYIHLNSIAVTPDGNLLVSARETWSLYKLDRESGEVIWRMGGKRGDFAMGDYAQFAWQHHAIPIGNRAISVFDDGSDGTHKSEPQSRGIVLSVDERARKVALSRSYTHPTAISSAAMGSVQLLPNGHVEVGWGLDGPASEFTADGRLASDARMPAGIDSYRAMRFDWHGAPATTPAVALDPDRGSVEKTVYASWNGATHARLWQVHAGPSPRDLRPIGIARRRGFETAIRVGRGSGYLRVSALDRFGRHLASSPAIRI